MPVPMTAVSKDSQLTAAAGAPDAVQPLAPGELLLGVDDEVGGHHVDPFVGVPLAGEDQFIRVPDPAGRVVVEVADHGLSGRTLRSG